MIARSVRRALEDCIRDQRKEIDVVPTEIHTDLGTNLNAATVQDMLRTHECSVSNSAAHFHQSNGLVEKAIRDITEAATVLLNEKGLPHKLWAEAVRYAVYTDNVVWKSALNKTQYEAYRGRRPNLSHIKAGFGDEVRVHVPKVKRKNKLDYKDREGYLVGYTDSSVFFRVCNKSYTAVTEETNVKFLTLPQPSQPTATILMTPEMFEWRLPGDDLNDKSKPNGRPNREPAEQTEKPLNEKMEQAAIEAAEKVLEQEEPAQDDVLEQSKPAGEP